MSRHASSLPPDYFARLYAGDPDPWRFASSGYEREKYGATLASLPRPRYEAALEIGCSIGVFTRRLADRCDTLVALDVVPAVLDAARDHCADRPHVEIRQATVPGDWPEGCFDLIVISEVAYYLDRADLGRLAGRVRDALRPGGDIVLVHWIGETDYPLTGDEAAEGLIESWPSFRRMHGSRDAQYRLDVLRAGTV